MKKIFLSSLFFLFSTLIFAQTPDAIFDKYMEITGGKTLWEGINNYTVKQSYKGNSAADYDMEYRGSFAEGAMYKGKTILKRTFIYAIKGNDAWRKVPLGSPDKAVQYETNDLSEKEQQNMRRELREIILPFWDYQAKGYIATLIGTETLADKKVDQVELSGKGIKYNLYFDQATGLLVKKKLTLPSGEIITEDIIKYSDSAYGVKYASESNYMSSIDKRNLKLTSNVIFNDDIPSQYFTR